MQRYDTDWLSSSPVFYHERTGKISHNINEVIDFSSFEFHPEGFNHFLDFGYSVFGQTPIQHVKYLLPSSRLSKREDGSLQVSELPDPVEQWEGKVSSENDVIQQLHQAVHHWEAHTAGEIIIPTSGGYDSRLLNLLVTDKSRIRSFTYGISEQQNESYEVVYARKVSEILGTRWEAIPLGHFHQYFREWDQLFGISTHAHGMYHLEFFSKILSKVNGGNPFLSGIIGDAWAGSVHIEPIKSAKDVIRLGYSHGIQADASVSHFNVKTELLESYYEAHRHQLESPNYRVIASMRFKMILLSYLMSVPRKMGFQPWSPFLEPSLALGMLTLPPHRRQKRVWQQELFQKHGLNLEVMELQASFVNTLDHQAMNQIKLKPLDVQLLKEVVKPSYVEWINNKLADSFVDRYTRTLLRVKKVGGVLRRLGLRDEKLRAYNAYLTLKPIENVLVRRNQS